MSDKEKIAVLVSALETVRTRLGITRDFVPLGVALDLAQVIENALKVAKS